MMHAFRTIALTIVLAAAAFAQSTDSVAQRIIAEKKWSESAKYYEGIAEKEPKNAEARYYQAFSLMLLQKFDDAQDAVEEAIDIAEPVAKYHLLRGQILGQKAMTANVVSQGFLAPKIKNAFLRASELDPSNIEARQALYNYYVMAPGFMGGSNEKALEQANAVVKLDAFRGHLMLGSFHLRVKKDSAEAERQWKAAIAAEPGKGQGYKSLGYLYMNQKRYSDALAQMQRYIDADPKNADAYDSYADVLKDQQQYDKAIEKYLYAISVNKKYSASIYSLAECYAAKGLRQKAKETFQWFLTEEPEGRRAEAAKKKINEL